MKFVDFLKGVNASRRPVGVCSWRMLVPRYTTRHRWSPDCLVPAAGGFSRPLSLRDAAGAARCCHRETKGRLPLQLRAERGRVVLAKEPRLGFISSSRGFSCACVDGECERRLSGLLLSFVPGSHFTRDSLCKKEKEKF